MKQHLHKHLKIDEDQYLGFHFNLPIRTFFVDDKNYEAYCGDTYYEMYGKDEVKESPFYMAPPDPGIWHLVIEALSEGNLDIRIEVLSE